MNTDQMVEIPTEELTDPFKPAYVEEILCLVKIRDNLTTQEHSQVQSLISEFADVFVLSVRSSRWMVLCINST